MRRLFLQQDTTHQHPLERHSTLLSCLTQRGIETREEEVSNFEVLETIYNLEIKI